LVVSKVLYMEGGVMTLEETRAWARLVAAVLAYGIYIAVVIGRTGGRPLTEAPYAAALLWTIGASIVGATVVETVIRTANPKDSRVKDARDRQIGRLGDYVGQSFVVIGAFAAMFMALGGWQRFWIANVIYLCFVASAVLGNVTKIVVYRGTFPQW
jgi:branched-subunit amino acid ABC-type transport system permease component